MPYPPSTLSGGATAAVQVAGHRRGSSHGIMPGLWAAAENDAAL